MKALLSASWALLLLLAGCSMPYRTPLVERVDSTGVIEKSQPGALGIAQRADAPTPSFEGLAHMTDRPGPGGGKAILITIHGMCHHECPWFLESTCRFAEAVELDPPAVERVPVAGDGKVAVYRSGLSLPGSRRELRMYGIVYSNATLEAKRKLCGDVSEATDVCDASALTYSRERVDVNADGKNDLMNNCLADAVAYLGPAGETVRRGVRQALLAIAADLGTGGGFDGAPVAVLSESLGSKILSDVLLCSSSRQKEELSPLFSPGQVEIVFYSANQIPLLNLGTKGTGCGGASEMSLAEALDAGTVVSFTDPNDLLSYEVLPSDVGNRRVYNVIVSNDLSWFGKLENPKTAHTGYQGNNSVVNMIMCGYNREDSENCGKRLGSRLEAFLDQKRCERYAEENPKLCDL
jgi:hypothetical protein